MILDSLLAFIPKGKTLKYELYTKPDAIYSVWIFGFNLGLLLVDALPLNHNKETNAFNDSLKKFIRNYSNIKTTARVNENETINALINSLTNETLNYPAQKATILKIADFLASEIETNSAHLAHLFLFGFGINKLRATLLKPDMETQVADEIQELIDSINAIGKGDKKLESPNLELSAVNLKTISLSLRLMHKKTGKIIALTRQPNELYYDFINNKYFQAVTDILLDVKNPVQLIEPRYKWLLYVAYYYLIVIYIILIYHIYNLLEILSPGLLTNIKNFDFKESDIVVSIILPVIIYGIYYSYKWVCNQILTLLTGNRIEANFKKIIQ